MVVNGILFVVMQHEVSSMKIIKIHLPSTLLLLDCLTEIIRFKMKNQQWH